MLKEEHNLARAHTRPRTTTHTLNHHSQSHTPNHTQPRSPDHTHNPAHTHNQPQYVDLCEYECVIVDTDVGPPADDIAEVLKALENLKPSLRIVPFTKARDVFGCRGFKGGGMRAPHDSLFGSRISLPLCGDFKL